MNSNNRGRNDKQEELVKRLEEIRNRRNAAESPTNRTETQTAKQEPRRNVKRQKPAQPTPSRGRRNEQAQKRQAASQPARSAQQGQRQQSRPPEKMAYEVERYEYERRKRQEAIAKKTTKMTKNTRKSSPSKTLIKQLSDGQSLADAMVLSEVLSKPIALRKRSR